MRLENRFEGGTHDANLTTANSGGDSGDSFDVSRIQVATDVKFWNLATVHGGMGMRTASNGDAGSGFSRVGWTSTKMGTVSVGWWRFYVSQTETNQPNMPWDVWQGTNIQTTRLCGIRIEQGRIRLCDGGGTEVDLTAVGFYTPTSFVRVEVQYDRVSGAAEARLFRETTQNLHGTTPDDVLTGTVTTGSAIGSCSFGTNADETVIVNRFDHVAFDDTAWIGPASERKLYQVTNRARF